MYRLLVPALLCATPAAAAPFQDTGAIDRAVAAFTGQGTGAAGGARSAVDARLKLAACPMVSLAWRSDAHDAVVVTCTGPAWRIFVPVLVAANELRRSAPSAAAVAPRVDPVIRRGDPVTIEAGTPSFSITREGVALGDAAPGARFLVKVEGGKAPVQAVAIEAGRATLPGWTE